MIVNPFNATDLLLHPIKTTEDKEFLIFSGGIERDQ